MTTPLPDKPAFRVDSGCLVVIENVSNGYILNFTGGMFSVKTFYCNLDAVLIALREYYEVGEEP